MAFGYIVSLLALFSLVVISNCLSDQVLSDMHDHNMVLDANYKLYWSYDRENVTFAVRVRTTGWVGFGLSPDGMMINSDVVVGWVESDGRVRMDDRSTNCRCQPVADIKQDWILLGGDEMDGFTTLMFKRPFDTNDPERDRPITGMPQFIIWSYRNGPDPTDPDAIQYHTRRGSANVNLLPPVPTAPTQPTTMPTVPPTGPDADLTRKYRFNKVMDPSEDYKLYWSFNLEHKNITFAVRVKTAGWVGLGLSPDGQMLQSDVIIGWVDNNGQPHLHDRFTGSRRARPPIDAQQDWFLIYGEEQDGYTTLEFTRQFETCDQNDLVIKAETQRVLWSFNNNDPVDENSPMYHGINKGSKSLNLLGGLENERSIPNDTKSFFARNTNLSIPEGDTTYWCSRHLLFNVTREFDTEIYVYRARPLIDAKNTRHVHHMLVFICPTYSDIDRDGLCSEITNYHFGCFGGQVLGAWAVGGEDFVFPEDVGFPIYIGPDETRPFQMLLEVHYDQVPAGGIIDSSGMEFFYTKHKPRHLAGTIAISAGTNTALLIPPNAESFSVTTQCCSSCTERYLPESGVTVFGSFLHSHLIGTALTVRHYRKCPDCPAVEELAPVDENLSYDFDFQQVRHLPNNVQIKRGDMLSLRCSYKSKGTGRSGVTLGGESTRQEMCQAMLLYYPKTELATCGSFPDAKVTYRPFLQQQYRRYMRENFNDYSSFQQLYDDLSDDLAVLGSDTISIDRYSEVPLYLNFLNWDQQAINDLQTAVDNIRMSQSFCASDRNNVERNSTLEPVCAVDVACPFQPVNLCTSAPENTPSCCERQPVCSTSNSNSIAKRSAYNSSGDNTAVVFSSASHQTNAVLSLTPFLVIATIISYF